MAEGAWIPAFDSIWNHRKTSALSRAMAKIPSQRRHAIAGMFLELMSWARDTVDDGDLGRVDPGDLAAAVGIPRARGGELLEALKLANLVTNDDRAHVLGWEDGPGKLVERRAKDRRKKADQRAREATERETKAKAEGVDRDRNLARNNPQPIGSPSAPRAAQVSSERPATPVRVEEPLSQGRPQGHLDLSPGTSLGESRQEKSRQEPHSPIAPLGTGGRGNGAVGRPSAMAVIEGADGLWREVLEELAKGMTEGTFVSWWIGTDLVFDGTTYIVTMPNAFALSWVKGKYLELVRSAIAKTLGTTPQGLAVTFTLKGGPREPDSVELA